MMAEIRTFTFSVLLLSVSIAMGLILAPTLLLGRRIARGVVRFWARLVLLMLRIVCGITHRIEGVENLPRNGALVAANHQSMWETIALIAILEKPVVVFKKELLRLPIYGWWGFASGSIPVDRKAGVRAIKKLTRDACRRINEGHQVVLFPEGTRTRAGERQKLQPGIAAIYAQAHVPCALALHNSGAHWHWPGKINSLKTPGVITLRFEPAIEAGLERKAFMKELQTRLSAGPDAEFAHQRPIPAAGGVTA